MSTKLPLFTVCVLFAWTALAGEFRVAPDGSAPPVERVGPPTLYMQDLDRYNQVAADARHLPWKEQPVNRDTYMKWIEDSGHLSYADNPKHGVYGPRHLMPVLAKYVQSKEPR